VASWFSLSPPTPGIPPVEHRFGLLGRSGGHPALVLIVGYRPGVLIEEALTSLETSYRRLLLAVLGLSGYSLLCLGAMVVQARTLSDRAARESAQRATLDLADRTCHELGNVVFVLANERRNLAEHLDQFDLLLDRLPEALAGALVDSGIEPGKVSRVRRAFDRRLADEGLDPEVELRTGSAIARDVARQISVCSQYIALTVRELDGYLKQSSLPVEPAELRLGEAIDEALTLLGPRIESASAEVDRPSPEGMDQVVLADRRLLVHALVNLLKNALEATARNPTADRPRITLSVEAAGPSSVRIEVRDNGPGLPGAVASRLFEPGFSTKGAGRGRGLAIARDSIRAQGGTLRLVPSEGPGARFQIELPAPAVGHP
jgi:two-component system C4-dicarboxylate transport sensor histidine kinase DctB